MAINFKNTAASSLKAMQSALTTELKSDAISAGWPKKYANRLSVRVDQANVYVDYPDDMAEAIEDLEYGNGSESPMAVMRLFIDRHADDFQNLFADMSLDALVAEGAIP